MRIISNEKTIQWRTRLGEYLPLASLLLLIVATVLLFVMPALSSITLIIMGVSLVLSLSGAYLSQRYVGPEAHHLKVQEALEKLDDDYTLLLYRAPAPFVLVSPGGLTVITVRSHSGKITFRDGKWEHEQKHRFWRRLAGEESLDKLDQMAQDEMAEMRRFLEKRMDGADSIPLRPLILFTHPEVEIAASDSPIPIFQTEQLKRWLRKGDRLPPLSLEMRNRLYQALGISAVQDA